jgi:pyrimidine nucleoside transport protein
MSLGEENPIFQPDESVMNASDKHQDVDNITFVMKKEEYKKQGNEKVGMFEDKEHNGNVVGNGIELFWKAIGDLVKNHWNVVRCLLLVTLVILYNAYLIGSIHFAVSKQDCLDYCDGVGFLLIITIIVYTIMFYFLVLKRYFRKLPITKKMYKSMIKPGLSRIEQIMSTLNAVKGGYFTILLIFAIFIFLDTANDPRRLISAFGILVLIGLGFIFSKHPGNHIQCCTE